MAGTTQIVLTALLVLTITVIPFLWGLRELLAHHREFRQGED